MEESAQNMECLEEAEIRMEFIEVWLGGEAIEMDLSENVNMFGRNQVGFRDIRCAFGQIGEFARGGGVFVCVSPRV